MAFWVLLAIAAALLVISYAILPKPKQPRPPAVQDVDEPTAEAGREIPVLFGSATVKGLNVLDFTDKSINSYQVKV